MKFQDFISGKRDVAIVISVDEYRRYRHVFKELYAEGEISQIDDYCECKWGSNRFLLCRPGHHPVMMYENAVTFIGRLSFKNVEFESGEVSASNGKTIHISTSCKKGVCPVCGCDVEYTGAQVYFLPWKCHSCHSTGKEGRIWLDGSSAFNGVHYDVTDEAGHIVAVRLVEVRSASKATTGEAQKLGAAQISPALEKRGDMTLKEMVMDFSSRPMGTKIIARPLLFTAKWVKGSRNDLLRKYLIEKSIPYFNDLNGTVWFMIDNTWSRAEFDVDDADNVTVYRCIFEEG